MSSTRPAHEVGERRLPHQGTCIHCEAEIDSRDGTYWSHVKVGPDGKVTYRLNRCQDSRVEYGHEAHPFEPCPQWCLGSRKPSDSGAS